MTCLGYLQQLLTDHRPPRTARTKKLKLLLPTSTLPLPKNTIQANDGRMATESRSFRKGEGPFRLEAEDFPSSQLLRPRLLPVDCPAKTVMVTR